jgi:outer membrane protein OmpA-like peptidoglycan-associated protein
MKALLTKPGNDSPSRKNLSPPAPVSTHPVTPISDNVLSLQRKPNCACGGSCPRCRGNYPLQGKLEVSQPGDTLEQEADRVAEQVLRMPQPEYPDNTDAYESTGLRLSRFTCGSPGQSSPEAPPVVHEVLATSGQPLDPATRGFMEARFGRDFSRVRAHTGSKAADSAHAVNALAYTVGRDIVFGAGHYMPETLEGKRLLAHELTHVIQQAGVQPTLQRKCGPALGPPTPDCTPKTGESSGEIFYFEVNCDDLNPEEVAHLKAFATGLSAGTTLKVHGFASVDGPAAFNRDLSCHRANKMAALLRSAAPAATVADIFKHGPTPGPAFYRRSVIVEAVSAAAPPTRTPTPPAVTPTPGTRPATPAPSPGFSDCSPAQTALITKGVTDARSIWLPSAISALSASPLNPVTVALLDKHFKTHTPGDVSVILDNFKKIEADMAGSTATYECEEWNALCAIGSAYTYCGNSTSHLCSDVFDNPFLITRTVVHERGHGVGLCEDIYCDIHEAKYKKMTKHEAIQNPDSYAAFAGELTGKFIC